MYVFEECPNIETGRFTYEFKRCSRKCIYNFEDFDVDEKVILNRS
jgi:hypothetical protein